MACAKRDASGLPSACATVTATGTTTEPMVVQLCIWISSISVLRITATRCATRSSALSVAAAKPGCAAVSLPARSASSVRVPAYQAPSVSRRWNASLVLAPCGGVRMASAKRSIFVMRRVFLSLRQISFSIEFRQIGRMIERAHLDEGFGECLNRDGMEFSVRRKDRHHQIVFLAFDLGRVMGVFAYELDRLGFMRPHPGD